MPRALVTGATGQDGSYLCELLLSRGYDVWGLVRPARADGQAGLVPGVRPVAGDVTDTAALRAAVAAAAPDEVYHLAARSSVGGSWDGALATAEVTGLGTLRLLEAVRHEAPAARVAVAGSSEVFGRPDRSPQDESTPLAPVTPYGVAKALAHQATVAHRRAHGSFAVVAVLYNHESERRPEHFVTRKVTRAAARIARGLQDSLVLGALDTRRDWGFAGDHVRALHLALQADAPDDYVVATGVTHSVRDLLDVAFARAGLGDWAPYVVSDPSLLRPAEPGRLVGDATRARERLGWAPTVGFRALVERMVDADLAATGAAVDRSALGG